MKGKKKLKSGTIAVSIVAVTAVTAVFAAVYNSQQPNKNPWSHTLMVSDENGDIKYSDGSLTVNGDIRSNGSITLNGKSIFVSGYAASSGNITAGSSAVFGDKYEDIAKMTVPDVWDGVFGIAKDTDLLETEAQEIIDNSLVIDGMVISDTSLNIDVSADYSASEDSKKDNSGKIGAFGAGFFTKAYENKEKWQKIFPVLFKDFDIETDSVNELGENSNFIPVQEQGVSDSWTGYDELPGPVITDNFSENRLKDYINTLKQDNPVFSVCSSDFVTVQSNASINPEEAKEAEKLLVEGGNFTLDGDYENLEEIRFDNWGGSQLIGSFPNLKYIYKTTGSDMNLVGDFPALEGIYMTGGQLLLGSGDEGFKVDNAQIIDEYGPIIFYTAKDVNITNSKVVSTQMILMRGAGAEKAESQFNAENTLMAATSGVMFEDMNDSNSRRYEELPVFYSTYPISVVNCNFDLLQGAFISNNKSLIMANGNIDLFRGFIFTPEGVDEYRNSSAVGFYVNEYAYNISPNINNMNKQPDGTEEIGRISDFEHSNFPKELVSCVGDADNFLDQLETNNGDSLLGDMNGKPGEILLGRYILAEGDISISADSLKNSENTFSVISSHNGDITITVENDLDVKVIIYAPNGKVTINTDKGKIYGRIFAKDIEISSTEFEITGGTEDISYLGFIYNDDSDSTDTSITDSENDSDKDSSNDDSDTESSNSESSSTDDSDNNSSTDSNDDSEGDSSSSDSKNDDSSSSDSSESESDDPYGIFKEPEYKYDKLNRLVKVIYDENNYIEYQYDANGNITKVITVEDGIEQ